MSREPIVFRPRVTPDPQALARLEEQRKRFVPPADVILHRDCVQPRIRQTDVSESLPGLLRRQAG